MKFRNFLLLAFVAVSAFAHAQDGYKYSVDLTKLTNDELKVELLTPKVTRSEIIFYMPKIVPGTYNISDFGKFVRNVKAYDKAGKSLPVATQSDSNAWKIKNATKLYKIEYTVEDTWDAKFKHNVYEMAGTNFEAGKNFAINTCGIFGYLDGMKKLPFELNFTRPVNFYASTAMVPVSTSAEKDVFRCDNADRLYDSPVMFCVPDTTTIKVGVTDVLVSVYSPKHLITSKGVADNLKTLLFAAKNYLGGKLPVNRYAFIYYFNSEQPTVQGQGAWEHSYSSFYSLRERPEKDAMNQIVDFSSHEFFHIITPLNICSKEVREFNFNKAVLSKHLWLYEGSTEYDAQHTQVTQGMITPEEYLKRISQKIFFSRKFMNDTLPFTELSLGSADKYNQQYYNVYQKGALINACLDLLLNKLSGGNYGEHNLKHDLSIMYGPRNYFNDNELFDKITQLTYPEVRTFFSKYVEGNLAIPYEEYFGMAGVNYIVKRETESFTLGGFTAGVNEAGNVIVDNTRRINEFGKKMGYQKGDEVVSVNGVAANAGDFAQQASKFLSTVKEGDTITVVVKRKNTSGSIDTVTLSAPAMKIKKTEEHVLEFNPNPTPEQLKIRNAWLNLCNK
ncbi:MAG: peptidase M61 [Sphingobacteriales bacterium]|nr:peptidase M61 [Sphingobacteriales bacterium]MBI3719751.1 peptidase M61 [Sphingobacteriales bacterium]